MIRTKREKERKRGRKKKEKNPTVLVRKTESILDGETRVSDAVIASGAFVRIGLHGIRGRRWKRAFSVGSAPSWLRVNKRGRNNFAFGISTA